MFVDICRSRAKPRATLRHCIKYNVVVDGCGRFGASVIAKTVLTEHKHNVKT